MRGEVKGVGVGGRKLWLWTKAIFEYSLSVAVFSLADWPSSYVRDWWLLLFFLEDFGFDIKFLVFAVDSFTS
jgi:hypothetical protein